MHGYDKKFHIKFTKIFVLSNLIITLLTYFYTYFKYLNLKSLQVHTTQK